LRKRVFGFQAKFSQDGKECSGWVGSTFQNGKLMAVLVDSPALAIRHTDTLDRTDAREERAIGIGEMCCELLDLIQTAYDLPEESVLVDPVLLEVYEDADEYDRSTWLNRIKDFRMAHSKEYILSDTQKRSWGVRVVENHGEGPDVVFQRPDGNRVSAKFVIDRGCLLIHTFGADQAPQAQIRISDEGSLVTAYGGMAAPMVFNAESERRADEPAKPWGGDWVELPDFGCGARMRGGVLETIPLSTDGRLMEEEDPVLVTDPEDQKFLDTVNLTLGTSFTMKDF